MDQFIQNFITTQGGIVAILLFVLWLSYNAFTKIIYPDFIKRPYDDAIHAQKKAAEDAGDRAKESESIAREAQNQLLQLMSQFQKSQQIQNETMQRVADEMATLIAMTKRTQDMIDECMDEKEKVD